MTTRRKGGKEEGGREGMRQTERVPFPPPASRKYGGHVLRVKIKYNSIDEEQCGEREAENEREEKTKTRSRGE